MSAMDVTSFPRGEMTTIVIEYLSTTIDLVGDGVAPEEGGWNDDPNKPSSNFSPYVVVMPLTMGAPIGGAVESTGYVIAPYALTFYGISREQLEFMSDRSREAALNIPRNRYTLQGLNQQDAWKIMQARCDSIGGISRSDNVEPSEYTQTDVINIYVSKEFS